MINNSRQNAYKSKVSGLSTINICYLVGRDTIHEYVDILIEKKNVLFGNAIIANFLLITRDRKVIIILRKQNN